MTAVRHFNLLPFQFEFQREVLLLDIQSASHSGVQIYTDTYMLPLCADFETKREAKDGETNKDAETDLEMVLYIYKWSVHTTLQSTLC